MGIRLKLTIPIIVLWCVLYVIFNYIWLPSYFGKDLQQYPIKQKQNLQMLFSGLVDPLLREDLAHVHETLQNALQQEDWIALRVWDAFETKLFPLEDDTIEINSGLQLIHYHLINAGALVATVELVVDPGLLLNEQQTQISRLRLLFFSIFIVSLIASLLLEEHVVRKPIARLANAATRLGQRDFSAELPKEGNDEIGQLVSSFGSMRKSLQSYQEELTFTRDQALGATKAKSEFLAKMSHELRTPLNAIIGYSEMLKDDLEYSMNGHHIEDVAKITDAGRHLLSLINDVLDISKIESGKSDLKIERACLPNIIDEVISTIQPMAENSNNTIESIGTQDITYINTDLNKLRQILLNLLSNACKFTKNGHIKIDTSLYKVNSQEYFKISISDDGIGISQQDSDRLFKAFSQVDDSYSRKYEGSGLGLHICSQLCQIMQGEIRMTSQQGKGSTFYFWLPIDLPASINYKKQFKAAS